MTKPIHGIMAMPVDVEGAHITAGSRKQMGDCGHEVYISPSSAELIDNPNIATTIRCLRCMKPEDMEGGIKATPGAQAELFKELGPLATLIAFKRLGVEVLDPTKEKKE